MIAVVPVCVQWVNPSTLKRGTGTTGWSGTDAVLWWTPGGKLVTNTRKCQIHWLYETNGNTTQFSRL